MPATGIIQSGSAAFSPADLSPEIWLDPSDLSTLWQDTAGTTAVTADGQSVARIDDKSGNGHHATQATASLRPIYKTSGGLHWLQFDGTNDWLGIADDAGYKTATISLGMACAVSTLASIVGYPHAATHTEPWWRWAIFKLSSTSIHLRIASDDGVSTVSVGTAARVWSYVAGGKRHLRRIAADLAIKDIEAGIAARAHAKEIRMATAGFWEMRLLTFAIAFPFVSHLWAVWIDTQFRLGWGIPKFPEPMNEWQGAILLSFFGIYTLGKTMQSIGAAIAMRRR